MAIVRLERFRIPLWLGRNSADVILRTWNRRRTQELARRSLRHGAEL
jgi:hypothetical protein